MTAQQLAGLVLQMLARQQRYFRAKPGPEKETLLAECKQAEGYLRKVCRELVEADAAKPGLFENPPTTRMPD